jgi:hypothetical protein
MWLTARVTASPAALGESWETTQWPAGGRPLRLLVLQAQGGRRAGVARALAAVCEAAPRAAVRALAPPLWAPLAALLAGGAPGHGVLARCARDAAVCWSTPAEEALPHASEPWSSPVPPPCCRRRTPAACPRNHANRVWDAALASTTQHRDLALLVPPRAVPGRRAGSARRRRIGRLSA